MTFETKKAEHFLFRLRRIYTDFFTDKRLRVLKIPVLRISKYVACGLRFTARNKMGPKNCLVLGLAWVYLELGALVSGAIQYPSVQWSFQNPR